MPSDINWTNTQVSSCATAGTTSCIQLRADAVGYAVTQLLSNANSSELVTNQFQVGLYPFIRYLYSYFPLTTNLTGTGSGTLSTARHQPRQPARYRRQFKSRFRRHAFRECLSQHEHA